jgi:hypothetical protein
MATRFFSPVAYQQPSERAPVASGSAGPPRSAEAPPSVQFATSINQVAREAGAASQAPTIALAAKNLDAASIALGLDIGLTRPLLAVAAIGAVAALVALAIYDGSKGAGVAVGAVLATANLWAFARIGTAALGRRGVGTPWILIAPLKLGLLFAAVVALLKAQIAGPIDFLVGYLALPVGIVISQLVGARAEMEQGPPL